MMSRFAFQLVFAGVLLASFAAMPVCAQAPETSVDTSTPASRWPEPVKDNRPFSYITFGQLEGRTTGPNTSFKWDGQGWIGTDFNKLWIKSEGMVTNGITSDGDQEILYDRPIPHTRYFAAIGVQGLAPHWFNFAPTIYVRDGGREETDHK